MSIRDMLAHVEVEREVCDPYVDRLTNAKKPLKDFLQNLMSRGYREWDCNYIIDFEECSKGICVIFMTYGGEDWPSEKELQIPWEVLDADDPILYITLQKEAAAKKAEDERKARELERARRIVAEAQAKLTALGG